MTIDVKCGCRLLKNHNIDKDFASTKNTPLLEYFFVLPGIYIFGFEKSVESSIKMCVAQWNLICAHFLF